MSDTMTMPTGGSEAGELTKRRSRWDFASYASLVLGLVVYASGVLIYASSYHSYLWHHVRGDETNWFRIMEWGDWAKGAGVILFMLGIVMYVAGRRKGV